MTKRDTITSSLDAVRGLSGIAITVVVHLLAMRTPRVAGWFLVLAGALFVHFLLEPATLTGVAGGLTLGLLAVLGSAFIAPWAGLPVMLLVAWGLEMARVAPTLTPHWQVRVGIHVGPVIGGVVGTRQYVFDILGDTVNLAARVQEVAMPGTVYLSNEAWNHIQDQASSEYIPGLTVRGKGQMDMYRLREVQS